MTVKIAQKVIDNVSPADVAAYRAAENKWLWVVDNLVDPAYDIAADDARSDEAIEKQRDMIVERVERYLERN